MNLPHIEKEYKMMISEDKYNEMISSLDLLTIKQTNYYYNTHNLNCAMRIRQIDNRFIFTLKEKYMGMKKEYEFDIPSNDLNNREVKEVLDKFNITEYEYLGSMTTIRSTKDFKYGQLCIDKSEYLNNVDYELEFELFDYTNDNNQEFLDLLDKYGLVYEQSKYSKYARFLNAYNS